MKDTSTRSGLLWEVERILKECKANGKLPQVLLMENVPMVIGVNNVSDFAKWRHTLEELGYSNYVECLNGVNYGIPQNRNRCFMISILGEYNYTFPKPIKLEKHLADLLEENVDEKYYVSDKMMRYLTGVNQKESKFPRGDRFKKALILTNCKNIAATLNTRNGSNPVDNYIIDDKSNELRIKDKSNKEIHLNTNYKKLIETIEQNEMPINKVKHMDLYNRNLTDNYGTLTNPCHNNNRLWDGLRIRKLTPKECFRLMGVKDEDFEKIKENQSEMSLYHLAGDSIICNVLCAIFKQLF